MIDTALLDRVDAWIGAHRRQMIADLINIVRVPSISIPSDEYPPFGKGCRDAIDTFLSMGVSYGYEAHNYDYYVGELTCGRGDESIGIWNHLDVVPVPDISAWSYPPFKGVVVKDRYLIGRGAQDNKMPAIGALYALNFLRESGVPLRHRYSLFLGTNEEAGMADIVYYTQHYVCPTLNLVPDSGFPVCIAERGSCTLRISTPTLTAFHGLEIDCQPLPGLTPETVAARLPDGRELSVSTPSVRISERKHGQPIVTEMMLDKLIAAYRDDEAARKSLSALLELACSTDGKLLGIDCSDELSGSLHLGAAFMGVENDCVYVDLMCTLPVSTPVDTLENVVAERCAARNLTGSLRRIRPPHSFYPDHPAVSKLTEIYNQVTGFEGKPFVMTGGTYASKLPRAFAFGPGMPGREFPPDIFRPGHGDYHQVDESEDLERMRQFTRVYCMTLMALNEMDVRV